LISVKTAQSEVADQRALDFAFGLPAGVVGESVWFLSSCTARGGKPFFVLVRVVLGQCPAMLASHPFRPVLPLPAPIKFRDFHARADPVTFVTSALARMD